MTASPSLQSPQSEEMRGPPPRDGRSNRSPEQAGEGDAQAEAPSHQSSATFGIEIATDHPGMEMNMIDEAVEQVVRRVVREELSELPAFAGRNEVTRASEDLQVLTVPEVAEVLRVSRNRAYDLVREGRLRSVRVGRRLLVPRWAVQELLGGEVHEPLRSCGYCGGGAMARYISRGDEKTVAPIDLCSRGDCHQQLLDDLRVIEAIT